MKAWSFSRYETWVKCPWRAKLQYDDRAPIPEDPKWAELRTRGTLKHEQCQAWVRGETSELPEEGQKFAPEFEVLKTLYMQGRVDIEHEWAWTQKFAAPCDWKYGWARIKLDFHVRLDPTTTLTIDLKTGKKSGNEIKHTEQGELYAVASYLRSGGTITEAQTEFWYLDQPDDPLRTTFPLPRILNALDRWTQTGLEITSGVYKAKPNIYVCKYCPFRSTDEGGTGACEFAVKQVKVTRKKASSGFFDFGKS